MYPKITVFSRAIGTYALLAAVGVIAAGAYAMIITKKRGGDDNSTMMVLLAGFIGAFLGSHLLYAIVNIHPVIQALQSTTRAWDFSLFRDALITLFGGSVFYGGLLGGLGVGFLYMRFKKYPMGPISDVTTPAIPLFHTFGRVGCFFGGCCYGMESQIGFTYTHAVIEQANYVHRFPVQLLEAACNLTLFIVLHLLLSQSKFQGSLLKVYLLIYAILRFGLEFFRGDTYRGFFLGLSTSQIVSILIVLFLLIDTIRHQMGRHKPDPADASCNGF